MLNAGHHDQSASLLIHSVIIHSFAEAHKHGNSSLQPMAWYHLSLCRFLTPEMPAAFKSGRRILFLGEPGSTAQLALIT